MMNSPLQPKTAEGTRGRMLAALALLLALLGATMAVTGNTTATGGTAPRLIAAHLEKHLSLAADQVSVSAITPENLPAGAQQFYVERKGQRDHGALNCIVLGEKVYCPGVDADFARLLTDLRWLDRQDASAAQLMRLYRLLVLPVQVMVLAEGYPEFPQIKPPALESGDRGLSLVFFASTQVPLEPRRWSVTVTHDYRVEVQTGAPLQPR